MAEQEGVTIRLHNPLPDTVATGLGQFVVIGGECAVRDGKVRSMHIGVADRSIEMELSPGRKCTVFWQAVLFGKELSGSEVEVSILVHTSSGEIRLSLGRIRCVPVDWQTLDLEDGNNVEGLVAICMATYCPEPVAFRRQLDSIREQEYRNWVCIINDDGTPEREWADVLTQCEGDSRIRCFRNEQNLGFYRNFEKSLTRVPEDADYVAFCDQDDHWYPGKLTRLLDAIHSSGAELAYSDMRIVDESGAVVSGTYWTNRRNEYRDLGTVLVANTVTGAASLFRKELLDYLVPFPPRVGDAFHDHWLACLAMSTGHVAYVDEPLYDYYQYGSSVIGHCDFTRFTFAQRLASLMRFFLRMCRPAVARPWLRHKYASALAVYRGECRRLRLVGQTIRVRTGVAPDRLKPLRLFDGGWRSLAGLLLLHVKVLLKGQTTDDAELRLAMGEFARIVEKYRTGGGS